MTYKVHRFDLRMTHDQDKLELFLNSLEGEVVAIIPNVAPTPVTLHAKVDFLLIVEHVGKVGFHKESPQIWAETAPPKVTTPL